MLNMNTRKYISDDGDVSLLDMPSTDERIDELASGGEYQKEMHRELEKALFILDDRTALMIKCMYYQGNSYGRTAEIFGCSRQTVNQCVKKGSYKILHSKHRKKLESFMWDGYRVAPQRLSDYVDMEEIDNMGNGLLL